MDVRKPGPKTFRCLLPGVEQPKEDEVCPVEFECMQRPAWGAQHLFLIPLEDDHEKYKPNRVVAEFLLYVERHGFASQEVIGVPRVWWHLRYDSEEDMKSLAAHEKGYTGTYNAYGWLEYLLPDDRYPPLLHTKDVDTFRHAYCMANEVLEGLSGFAGNSKDAQCYGGTTLSFSFIGQRETPWDWADEVVWSETPSAQVRTMLQSQLWPLYNELDVIERQLTQQDMPGSQLVHLNLAQYMESSDEGERSGVNLLGWFDPSTFFWRPLEYAKAVFVVDFLFYNKSMSNKDKNEIAKIAIKETLAAKLVVRAMRYRVLGKSQLIGINKDDRESKESDFLHCIQMFNDAFESLRPVIERFCTTRSQDS